MRCIRKDSPGALKMFIDMRTLVVHSRSLILNGIISFRHQSTELAARAVRLRVLHATMTITAMGKSAQDAASTTHMVGTVQGSSIPTARVAVCWLR